MVLNRLDFLKGNSQYIIYWGSNLIVYIISIETRWLSFLKKLFLIKNLFGEMILIREAFKIRKLDLHWLFSNLLPPYTEVRFALNLANTLPSSAQVWLLSQKKFNFFISFIFHILKFSRDFSQYDLELLFGNGIWWLISWKVLVLNFESENPRILVERRNKKVNKSS